MKERAVTMSLNDAEKYVRKRFMQKVRGERSNASKGLAEDIFLSIHCVILDRNIPVGPEGPLGVFDNVQVTIPRMSVLKEKHTPPKAA